MKIFLIGMMGSGKTYWMTRLGKKLKLPRYDLDELVEKVEDRSITEIFAESGEDHFRKMESIVLKWFADKDEFILATGGGTPCYHENMQWMNNEGVTVWLNEPVDVLVNRLLHSDIQRPLISGMDAAALKIFLEEKLAAREPFYSQAKIVLTGNQISENNLLSLIKTRVHA